MSLIEIDWNPDAPKLRQFALICFCGFLLLGLLFAWRLECLTGSQNCTLPALFWSIAAVIGVAGLLFPQVLKPVYQIWMAVTFPIGWLLSHLVLGIIYFGLFTLLGFIFRILGRDPLNRRRKTTLKSYWVKHSGSSSRKRYFQQF